MKIAVMGSGRVGGYFGARLAMGGAKVHSRCVRRASSDDAQEGHRRGGRARAIYAASVNATGDPAEIGIADLVLVV